MPDYRQGTHTVYDIQYHFVGVTKYRYQVLRGETAERAREIIRQVCASREITILKGPVSSDHGHLMVSAPPTLSPAQIAQFIKGVSSRQWQDEFPLLKKTLLGTAL